MPIITLEKYKQLAGIPQEETGEDERIKAYIDIIEGDYLNIRNKPFDTVLNEETGEQDIIYPNGAEFTAFEMLQYKMQGVGKNGVISESIGNYSYSLANNNNDYPDNITKKIKKWANSNVNRPIL